MTNKFNIGDEVYICTGFNHQDNIEKHIVEGMFDNYYGLYVYKISGCPNISFNESQLDFYEYRNNTYKKGDALKDAYGNILTIIKEPLSTLALLSDNRYYTKQDIEERFVKIPSSVFHVGDYVVASVHNLNYYGTITAVEPAGESYQYRFETFNKTFNNIFTKDLLKPIKTAPKFKINDKVLYSLDQCNIYEVVDIYFVNPKCWQYLIHNTTTHKYEKVSEISLLLYSNAKFHFSDVVKILDNGNVGTIKYISIRSELLYNDKCRYKVGDNDKWFNDDDIELYDFKYGEENVSREVHIIAESSARFGIVKFDNNGHIEHINRSNYNYAFQCGAEKMDRLMKNKDTSLKDKFMEIHKLSKSFTDIEQTIFVSGAEWALEHPITENQ